MNLNLGPGTTVMNGVVSATKAQGRQPGADDILDREGVARPGALRVCILADDAEKVRGLSARLTGRGLLCMTAMAEDEALEILSKNEMDLAMIAVNGASNASETRSLARRMRHDARLPVIALVSRGGLGAVPGSGDVDDFVVEPWDADEVAVRARRIVKTGDAEAEGSEELIRCGYLTIHTGRCEVHVDGRLVELTFKEYELLKFMASNKGRVFTREALLNKVWGYDYFGGDRTVDVHVRRLRSKLGESDFIDTVRNIGYRFSD